MSALFGAPDSFSAESWLLFSAEGERRARRVPDPEEFAWRSSTKVDVRAAYLAIPPRRRKLRSKPSIPHRISTQAELAREPHARSLSASKPSPLGLRGARQRDTLGQSRVACFGGYAIWTYLTEPFPYAYPRSAGGGRRDLAVAEGNLPRPHRQPNPPAGELFSSRRLDATTRLYRRCARWVTGVHYVGDCRVLNGAVTPTRPASRTPRRRSIQ
jgi:hypothetical protein